MPPNDAQEAAEPPSVVNPVDEALLAEEAENVLATEGEQSTGDDNLPGVEFYYGRIKQNGRWIRTGKIYWIYTTYHGGQRKRVSPSKIYRREKGVTSIDKCPYAGRVLEFRSRSLGVGYTGGTGIDGRFSSGEGANAEKLASQ